MADTFCFGTALCSPSSALWLMTSSASWVDWAGLSTFTPMGAPGDLGVGSGELALSAAVMEPRNASSELKDMDVPAPVRIHLGPGRHAPTPGILRELREPARVRPPLCSQLLHAFDRQPRWMSAEQHRAGGCLEATPAWVHIRIPSLPPVILSWPRLQQSSRMLRFGARRALSKVPPQLSGMPCLDAVLQTCKPCTPAAS
jgi:hypothetical protein